MFEGGIKRFFVKDAFMRGRTGDERPSSPIPSYTGDGCVTSTDVPPNCIECRYGGGGSYLSLNSRICCGHQDAPNSREKVMESFVAQRGRPAWCPLATSHFTN